MLCNNQAGYLVGMRSQVAMVQLNNKTGTKLVALNRIGSVNTQLNVACQNLTIDYFNGEYITAMELDYNLKKNISFV